MHSSYVDIENEFAEIGVEVEHLSARLFRLVSGTAGARPPGTRASGGLWAAASVFLLPDGIRPRSGAGPCSAGASARQ